MTAYFVTGAGTEIGKTHVASALLAAWTAQGLVCDAFKPVVSGVDESNVADSDPARLLAALGDEATPEAIARVSPWRLRAPLAPPIAARAEGRVLRFEEIAAACEQAIDAHEDVLLIEGAGGLMAPLTDDKTGLDLIARLEAPVIFVAGSYLGAVSHALTALECLDMRGLAVAAVIVSESEGGVELDSICAMLRAFRPGGTIVPAPLAPALPPPDWAIRLAEQLER